MTLWQAGDITVGGLRLHYTRTGGDRPAVVLAHGITDDGLCWTPVADLLAPDYDVVMVDARGHGRSDGPEHGYGLVELASDLAGVIAGLGLERPAILGHSMGAITTLALAGTYPEVPRAILLEDPPAWWVQTPEPGWREQRRAGLVALKRKTREELIADRRREDPRWSEAELGPWADSKLRVGLHIVNWDSLATVDWPNTLRQVTCPALLITADPERGAIVTPETAEALKSMVPQAKVTHIPGAGHSIHRDQFTRYMELVRAFLAETVG